MSSPQRTSSILAAATALTALLPPVLQAAAEARIEERVSVCSAKSEACGSLDGVQSDIGGLRLFGARRAFHGREVRAQIVEIRPTFEGVEVHISGLTVRDDRAGDAAPGRASPPATAPDTVPAMAPAEPFRLPNRGIPIRVVAPGTVAFTAGATSVELVDPWLEVDNAGLLTAHVGIVATHPKGSVRSLAPLDLRPTHGTSTWRADGLISIAHGPQLELHAELSRQKMTGTLGGARSGSLSFEVERAPVVVRVQADEFALASLGSVARSRVRGGEFDARLATLDGDFEARLDDRNGRTLRVHMESLQLDGGTARHPRLSADDIELGTLTVTGDIERSHKATRGQITAEHDGVGVHVFAALSDERVTLHAELAQTQCQTAFEAIPTGFVAALAGIRVEGELSGTLDLDAEFSALQEHQAALERHPEDDVAAPGRFELDFAPLDACAVLADPAAIDLRALVGPYRHRFVDADGRARSRTMAPGDPGFVSVRAVPLLAAAFTTLEDARYFTHDGFDRKHIENAVWHNLEQGSISRGASTITQQAARNLFLGVDRTVSRKLQEAVLAQRLEQELDKKRVLELYLNIIELGPGVHGVEEAAQYHFGKSAHQLRPAQAIHIAKLAPAPNTYSERWRGGEVDQAWLADIHYQLKRLRYHHVITSEVLKRELKADLGLLDRTRG